MTVHVWAKSVSESDYRKVGTVATTKSLRATDGEYLSFNYPMQDNDYIRVSFMLTFGDDAPLQCSEDNDVAHYIHNCPVN